MEKFQVRRTAISAPVAGAVLGALAVLSNSANAALDVTAATAGVTDASTAVLAICAAMLTMSVAVWGIRKVIKFFRG